MVGIFDSKSNAWLDLIATCDKKCEKLVDVGPMEVNYLSLCPIKLDELKQVDATRMNNFVSLALNNLFSIVVFGFDAKV